MQGLPGPGEKHGVWRRGDPRRSVSSRPSQLPIPVPGAIPGLASATRRLLALEAARHALVEPAPADPVGAFWEPGQVVALKVVEGEQVVVIRYDGPLFNPGTVPESKVRSEGYGFPVCHRESIGDGGEFEYLIAYAIGVIAEDGQWKDGQLDPASRDDLVRDIPAMEELVERGRLSGLPSASRPLPDFPAPAAP